MDGERRRKERCRGKRKRGWRKCKIRRVSEAATLGSETKKKRIGEESIENFTVRGGKGQQK